MPRARACISEKALIATLYRVGIMIDADEDRPRGRRSAPLVKFDGRAKIVSCPEVSSSIAPSSHGERIPPCEPFG